MTEEEIHNRFAELENRVTGLEMTLAEISFYAHDVSAGTFEKDVLASRLITLAKQVPQIFRDPTIAEQIAFQMAIDAAAPEKENASVGRGRSLVRTYLAVDRAGFAIERAHIDTGVEHSTDDQPRNSLIRTLIAVKKAGFQVERTHMSDSMNRYACMSVYHEDVDAACAAVEAALCVSDIRNLATL